MNQVQVWQFGLILRQEGATASRKPLECLWASKTANKTQKMPKNCPHGPPMWGGPEGALGPPVALALWGSTSGAVYTSLAMNWVIDACEAALRTQIAMYSPNSRECPHHTNKRAALTGSPAAPWRAPGSPHTPGPHLALMGPQARGPHGAPIEPPEAMIAD